MGVFERESVWLCMRERVYACVWEREYGWVCMRESVYGFI